MTLTPSGSRLTRLQTGMLILAVILPVLFLAGIRLAMLESGTEFSSDTLYHIRISELGPKVFMDKVFPWTQDSIWGAHFADKELLFHGALWGMGLLRDCFRIPCAPPFQLAIIPFLLLLSGGFVFAARRAGASPAVILWSSLLLCAVTPNFTFRILMLRPHLAAIALILFMCGILFRGTTRQRLLPVLLMSTGFAWTYSNPHFIVVPVAVLTGVEAFRERRIQPLILPLVSLAGVVLGLLVHPQFPNTFLIWKVQCIDALFSPISQGVPIPHPMEMMSPGFRWHLSALPLYAFVYFDLLMLTRLAEQQGLRAVPVRTLALAVLTILFTAGTFLVIRAVEYAAPFTFLLFADLLTQCLHRDMLIPFRRQPRKLFAVVVSAILALAMLNVFCLQLSMRRGWDIRPTPGVSAWLNAHVPPDERVVNLSWSDFPILFFRHPEYRYSWGMDPMFAFTANPENAKLLCSVSPAPNGGRIPPPEPFYARFNARYALLLAPRTAIADYLIRAGWTPVYEGKDGVIFDLRESR